MSPKVPVILIIKMLQLPKIGRKTAFKLVTNLNNSLDNDQDIINYIQSQSGKNRVPIYSDYDFQDAFAKANEILEDSEKLNVKIISYFDDEYPALLREIPDFPLILSYKGNLNILSSTPAVAIIGTRNASAFGSKYGRNLAKICAERGFNIISGLALGCDTAGHLGAIDAKGKTTAVLAHGLDYVYPAENKQLAQKILETGGLLISEYFVGTKGLPNYFVERDRIQAGLSLGTIVIETDIKSGTMHTVNYTINYGRRLGCVDFPNDSGKIVNNAGNIMLIEQKKASKIYEIDTVEEFLSTMRSANAELNVDESKTKKLELFTTEDKDVNTPISNQKVAIEKKTASDSKSLPSFDDVEIFLKTRLESVNQQIDQKQNELKKLKNEKKRIEKRLGISSPKLKKSSGSDNENLLNL